MTWRRRSWITWLAALVALPAAAVSVDVTLPGLLVNEDCEFDCLPALSGLAKPKAYKFAVTPASSLPAGITVQLLKGQLSVKLASAIASAATPTDVDCVLHAAAPARKQPDASVHVKLRVLPSSATKYLRRATQPLALATPIAVCLQHQRGQARAGQPSRVFLDPAVPGSALIKLYTVVAGVGALGSFPAKGADWAEFKAGATFCPGVQAINPAPVCRARVVDDGGSPVLWVHLALHMEELKDFCRREPTHSEASYKPAAGSGLNLLSPALNLHKLTFEGVVDRLSETLPARWHGFLRDEPTSIAVRHSQRCVAKMTSSLKTVLGADKQLTSAQLQLTSSFYWLPWVWPDANGRDPRDVNHPLGVHGHIRATPTLSVPVSVGIEADPGHKALSFVAEGAVRPGSRSALRGVTLGVQGGHTFAAFKGYTVTAPAGSVGPLLKESVFRATLKAKYDNLLPVLGQRFAGTPIRLSLDSQGWRDFQRGKWYFTLDSRLGFKIGEVDKSPVYWDVIGYKRGNGLPSTSSIGGWYTSVSGLF